MKTIGIIIWTLILLLIGCGNDTTKNVDHKKIKSWQKRQAMVTQALSDPIDIEWSSKAETNRLVRIVLRTNQKVIWTKEEKDRNHFQTYQETIDNGYRGDCEDIVFYWYEMIRRAEIVPDVGLFIRWVKITDDIGHTVLVIDHFDGEIIIDNGKMANLIEYEEIFYEYDIWTIY